MLFIPSVGALTASTILTEIGDWKQYTSCRDFAAAKGLLPRQYSKGNRTALLGISKKIAKNPNLLILRAKVFIQNQEYQSGE